MTLVEAVVLVFLVMWLFLQNIRYTLIPTVVVPVCLLGTLAVMLPLGFSVNMMTMFGMVLAIGILVDDAIVVVENVRGASCPRKACAPKESTIRPWGRSVEPSWASRWCWRVFLPLAFMSGSVGVIYRQFSISLAVSILSPGSGADADTSALRHVIKPIPGDTMPRRRDSLAGSTAASAS